jgi:hypothetical protein
MNHLVWLGRVQGLAEWPRRSVTTDGAATVQAGVTERSHVFVECGSGEKSIYLSSGSAHSSMSSWTRVGYDANS